MKFNKHITILMLISVALLPFSAAIAQGRPDNAGKRWVEGQIIVKSRAGLSEQKLRNILNKNGSHSRAYLHQIKAHVITVPAHAEDAILKALSDNPNIEYAEKDMLVELSETTPNDPKYGSQWFLPLIKAPEAWEASTGEGITVAILDTGVESTHPDLVDNIVPGWNVVSDSDDTSPVMWHGTSVAGVVAATSDNSLGVSSVAWNAKIMPIRVSNQSNGVASYSSLANGLLWAADHGADVANISYDMAYSSFINDAAQYFRSKGGVTVVSAGNSNTDGGYSDNPYVITVAATDRNDNKASFSNYGNYIDVTAPGKYLYTTTINGGYKNASGTSFSSPATAGVVALIMAANPDLTPEEVEDVLEQSADDLVEGEDWHQFYGHGRVNAAAAVLLAQGGVDVDTQAPSTTILSPQNNVTVSGDVFIEVSANDDTGVTGVDLYAGETFVGTDLTVPYQFTWDSTQVTDGSVTFTAYAQDSAGNEGVSNGLTVEVVNQPVVQDTTPPIVSLESPVNGSIVSGSVLVEVTATDDISVTNVDLYADGVLIGSDVILPYQFSWDSTSVVDGNVALIAYAQDAAGNEGVSSSLSVEVVNQHEIVDTTPPAVSLVNPVNGSTVSGNVLVEVDALDDTDLTGVDLYANGQFVGRDSTVPYSFSWDSTQVSNGNVSFTAYAQDSVGNEGVSSEITVEVDNQSNGIDDIAPIVNIENPVDGSAIDSGKVVILITGTDNVAVSRLKLFIDGKRYRIAKNSTTLTYNWWVSSVSSGSHVITAIAIDEAGNTSETSVTVWK